jgi:HD-like signal output (HDOD) protein
MVSVLFVDDDVTGLLALREAFGSCTQDWETAFVPGAQVALQIMAERPVDAVVTSARLSGMSAASFLGHTKTEYPRTARIALSSPDDRDAATTTLAVANQCLSRACKPELLTRTIEHTTRLHERLFSDATRRMVAEIGTLPSLPANLLALDAALSDEDCSLGRIAEIMSNDVAMTAKVLQLVNSSFFGLRWEVRDLRQAVAYLGVGTLRDFAMAGAAFRAFTPSPLLSADWLPGFTTHSLAVADATGHLVRTSVAQCEANVAGTLHGIGELVVAERAPAKLMAIAEEAPGSESPDEVEIRHIGTTFPVIGGYLLSAWGMSYRIVEAITCQREVWTGPRRDPELSDVVHVADYMAAGRQASADQEATGEAKPRATCPWVGSTELDDDYLERTGLLGAVRLYNQGFLQLL